MSNFFCFKKLGQVTIHFRLNKIRLQDVWWKSDRTVNIVVREALTKIRQATYDKFLEQQSVGS